MILLSRSNLSPFQLIVVVLHSIAIFRHSKPLIASLCLGEKEKKSSNTENVSATPLRRPDASRRISLVKVPSEREVGYRKPRETKLGKAEATRKIEVQTLPYTT